jgi:hypothetical protein
MAQVGTWSLITGGKGGLAVRTAIKNCFDALRSRNSGANAPDVELVEGQEFLEVPASGNTRTLKVRIGNAWRDVWSVDAGTGVFTLLAGVTAFARTLLAAADAAAGRAALGLGTAAVAPIVGTVSQVGGVPTGAIIEQGSNANGNYIRYANGVQECWGARFITPVANTPTSGAVTFPIAFSAVQSIQVSPDTSVPGTTVQGWSFALFTNTGCLLFVTRTNTTNTALYWRAIGRWF